MARAWLALLAWALGLLLFLFLGMWNLRDFRLDADNRLISEASRGAAQLASLLSLPGHPLDKPRAEAIVAGAMEDDRVYAVKVEGPGGLQVGQRRNYLWEPSPWDDEITENCARGMNTIRSNGREIGKVDIWLSPRLDKEEESLLTQREVWRFCAAASAWTLAFFFFFLRRGDFLRMLGAPWGERAEPKNGEKAEKIVMAMSAGNLSDSGSAPEGPVNAALGRKHQNDNLDAWLVTAGMFRQTFARGPALISRLYTDGETAGLCHLGRMLEQAAPCVGAGRLAAAARAMRDALNDPESEARAMAVEECAKALEEVLGALCGEGQWRSRSGARRS